MIEALAQWTSFSVSFIEILVGIYGVLLFFTFLFILWNQLKPSKGMREIVLRIYSWWAILILLTIVFLMPGDLGTITVAFLTFIALREFLTKLSIEKHFRKTLLYVYFTIPIQFYLAKYGTHYSFNAFIPIYMFFMIPMRNITLGKYENYLEFNGKVFWALMLIVFGFSQLSFLRHQAVIEGFNGGQELIILMVIFLTQLNDVLQFLWGKTIGRHKLSARISPNKTIEGFVGGAYRMGSIRLSAL